MLSLFFAPFSHSWIEFDYSFASIEERENEGRKRMKVWLLWLRRNFGFLLANWDFFLSGSLLLSSFVQLLDWFLEVSCWNSLFYSLPIMFIWNYWIWTMFELEVSLYLQMFSRDVEGCCIVFWFSELFFSGAKELMAISCSGLDFVLVCMIVLIGGAEDWMFLWLRR